MRARCSDIGFPFLVTGLCGRPAGVRDSAQSWNVWSVPECFFDFRSGLFDADLGLIATAPGLEPAVAGEATNGLAEVTAN
jgi:hypothetical protein